MTAVALGRAPRQVPVPVVLGLQEGWRIVRHPLAAAGPLVLLALVGARPGGGPRQAFELVATGPTFFYGVCVFFAAHLVASRDRRSRSRELLAAVPVPETGRVAALCVAALVPALLSLGLVLALDAVHRAQAVYVDAPSAWHLLQGPLTVLGGGLLGVMVARLTGLPGAPLLVMVAMVAANVWLSQVPALQPLAAYVLWTVPADDGVWAGLQPGSPAWHDAYLLGLCAMAATGAFLTSARHRGRVLLLGAAATAVTVAAGLASLP